MYLYLLNIASIIVAMTYLKNIYTDIEKIAELSIERKKLKKTERHNNIEEQLAYIDTGMEADRINFSLFYWKVLMFIVMMVAIISINRAAPLSFFGYRLNILTGIISGGILGYILIWLMDRFGIKS
jgi:hypothetical protein